MKTTTLELIQKYRREPASQMPRGCLDRRIYADFMRQEKRIVLSLNKIIK